MLPCVCSVTDHRWRQNVAMMFLPTFWRHLWSITEQTHGNMTHIYVFYIIKKQQKKLLYFNTRKKPFGNRKMKQSHWLLMMLSKELWNGPGKLRYCQTWLKSRFLWNWKEDRASTGFEPVTSAIEVKGSNPVETLIFFFMLPLSNCLRWDLTQKHTMLV